MLIRHSALYIGAKLVPGALGMATTAALTRILPPERYGRYGVALVIMSFGATLGFEWLGLAFLRLAGSRARAAATFDRLFGAVLCVAAAIGTVALLLVRANDRPIVAAGLVLMASYAWFEFRARLPVAGLAPTLYLRMNLWRAGAILLAAPLTAFLTQDPAWTAIATAGATLVGAVGGGTIAGGGDFDRALAGAAIRFGLPLAASLALSSATGSLTRALLGGLDGAEALGLYTAAFVLVQNTLVVLSSGLASAGFSLAVRALENGDAVAARRQLAANGALLLAVLAPAALGMALCADGLADTLVGARFRDAVASLTPWLATGAFLTGLRAHYLDHAFQLGHALGYQIWVTATAAIVTLGLGAVLIPRWGPLGAAMAVVAGAAASVVHAVVAGRAAFRIPLPVTQAARVAAACATMAAVVVALPSHGAAGLAARIGLGGIAYALAAVLADVGGSRSSMLRRLGWAR